MGFSGVILVFKGEYDVWSVFFSQPKKNACFGFSSQKAKGTCAQLAVEKIDQKHDNKNHWNHVNLLQVCVVFFCGLGVGEKKVDLTFFPFFLKHLL